jgi:hypothetical protein
MILRPVKHSLFIAVVINVIVLVNARGFYWDTRPGVGYKMDICSGTGNEFIYLLMGAIGLFVGMPLSVWSFARSATQRSWLSAWAAILALILNLIPNWFGRTLDDYTIRVHAAQMSQNCGD